MALRVWLWLLSLSVLWGGSFFFAKVAVSELGPFTVVFARVSLAALALALVVPLRRDAPWPTYFAMAF
jgi:drug/metabolite transporter (DMT)-like permease